MQNYLNTVFFAATPTAFERRPSVAGQGRQPDHDPADAAFMAALVNQRPTSARGWTPPRTRRLRLLATATETRLVREPEEHGVLRVDQPGQVHRGHRKFPVRSRQSNNSGSVDQQQMTQAVKNWIESYAAANPTSRSRPSTR